MNARPGTAVVRSDISVIRGPIVATLPPLRPPQPSATKVISHPPSSEAQEEVTGLFEVSPAWKNASIAPFLEVANCSVHSYFVIIGQELALPQGGNGTNLTGVMVLADIEHPQCSQHCSSNEVC